LRSQIYQNVIEGDQQAKLLKEEEERKKRELLDKRQNYARYIKMVYKPTVDEEKKQEL
jgi:hypothetical protein